MRKVVLAAYLGCIGVTAVAVADLEERVSQLEAAADLEAQTSRLSLGGYGEFHATRKGGDSYGDYHRVVMYAGYQFNDWIRLNSEIELEHSKAGDKGKVKDMFFLSSSMLICKLQILQLFDWVVL